MHDEKMRYTYTTIVDTFPLYIESVGYNPREHDWSRPDGYPHYHWLQTIEGEGTFSFNGQEHRLTRGRGVLLKPYTPHEYITMGKKWSTVYVTFGGTSVVSILDALKLNDSSLYTDLENQRFASMIAEMLEKIKEDAEFSKLDLSSYLYNFLIHLRKYGKVNNQPSLSNYYDKLRPMVEWLEWAYAEDIGLNDMAAYLNVSSQHLNRLFHHSFNMSPYSFLIQLRIRKAKEILIQNADVPLKNIAFLVGFNDVSNFVATFKKLEGMTPKNYRNRYLLKTGRLPSEG
ncbi:AraC family transcriptional regulator [Alkalicoccobacillus murimartini]|uniref:AraC-like DNA-binding protein n=1 Tax=Alkalicoccobacillus murimartini TaxID=171685 RepID=A0ABT9YPG1_9BACI|nr:AraC family transcriptional regulator [Alkalicoccobacillus murimartini]MDQ0209097.1 AraC-like DNA-binding protein [Alkalicoccobacillus murimartini]